MVLKFACNLVEDMMMGLDKNNYSTFFLEEE